MYHVVRNKDLLLLLLLNGNQDETVLLDGEDLKRVESFKYLGSVVDATSDTGKEVNYRIQCGWNN